MEVFMTIQEMKERKKELGLSNDEISKRSGVPFSTIQKVFSGTTSAPRNKTIQALEAVLKRTEEDFGSSFSRSQNSPVSYSRPDQVFAKSSVHEPAPAYAAKMQGEYTLEDYYAIPDERRVELIDGVIYDMAAPSVLHQKILAQLFLLFDSCISEHGGNCEVFLSPCDVQLDRDEKTMLQPDLFVLCRDYDISARSIPGAPDLTLEILSSSTRSKDMLLKTYKYLNAGVREYWIVDPEKRSVMVYYFEETDLTPETYSFDDVIPIHISEGKCSIDFGIVNRKIAAYYEH